MAKTRTSKSKPSPPEPAVAQALGRPALVLVCALLALFAAQAVWHAVSTSSTYDEVAHLTVGYLLWRTDHTDFDIQHPPLVRYLSAVPLLVLRPDLPRDVNPPVVPASQPLSQQSVDELYRYGSRFLFQGSVQGDTVLVAARLMIVLLATMLGLLAFLWSRRIFGFEGGIVTLALFAFCPNLIAHGSLVTTDLGGVACTVGFLVVASRFLERQTLGLAAVAGAALGCALASKFSNLVLVPAFLVAWGFVWLRQKTRLVHAAKSLGAVAAAAWLVVCMAYGFERVFATHTLLPAEWETLGLGPTMQAVSRLLPLPDSFLKGIANVAWHNRLGHGAFLLGEYSTRGWWYYFPFAFLVKTPTVTLLLVSLGAALSIRALVGRGRELVRRLGPDELLIWSTLAMLVPTLVSSRLSIGLRHMLLVYPLVYVLLGKTGAAVLRPATESSAKQAVRARRGLVVSVALVALLALEVGSVSPHYLAFFNRLAGGPEKGIDYLSDSNLDWGQDLKSLAGFLKRQGEPEVILSYFGSAVPETYGIRYQSLPTVWAYPISRHLNSIEPKKELLAVSATNLQGTYFPAHDLFAWLRMKAPVAKVGYSIYVYDVTADRQVHERLAGIYEAFGMVAELQREVERVRRMR